ATAFLAMNAVFGRFFDVDPVEALEPGATEARAPAERFVLDAQTHHVAAPRQFPPLLRLRALGRQWNAALSGDRGTMDELYLANYIREVFRDPEPDVAGLSGIPAATDAANILPPDEMARTREVVNQLAASRRLVIHGLVSPNKGPADLDEMR